MNHYLSLTLLALLAVTAQAEPARYTQAATGNALNFTFTQLDAASNGQFKKFSTELVFDEQNLAASSLNVTVEIGSVDTQDAERDEALKGAELFNAKVHASARYEAGSLTRNAAGGLEAVGKLTLRGVSKDLRLPLTLKPTATGLELSGQASIRRLDFGVGQGEWQSTESIGDEVKLQYKVALVRAK